MDYIQLNMLIDLYSKLYDDLYDNYLSDFSTDKNLMLIESIDFVTNINFIRRVKGFLAFDDVVIVKNYIIDLCFLYNYWQDIRSKEEHNKDILDVNIKNTVRYIQDTKNHLIETIIKESTIIIESFTTNE